MSEGMAVGLAPASSAMEMGCTHAVRRSAWLLAGHAVLRLSASSTSRIVVAAPLTRPPMRGSCSPGVRVSTVLMATVFGMALGGWVTGVIFDMTGSYQTAFLNGILWNVLNLGIAATLLVRPARPVARA